MTIPLFQKISASFRVVRWLIPLAVLIAYVIIFPKLYLSIGQSAIPFAQVVTISAGVLLGLRGGLFYGLATSVAVGFLATLYAGYSLTQINPHTRSGHNEA